MLFMRNKIIHFLNIQVMINRFFKVVFALPAILFCFKATARHGMKEQDKVNEVLVKFA